MPAARAPGLGLSIVKRMVEQMHGTLAFDSEVGRGTSFRVVLPRAKERVRRMPTMRSRRASGCRVAAFSSPTTTPTSRICSKACSAISVFACASSTTRRAPCSKRWPGVPDVLLIDVELSGLSGNAAVYKLRSRGYKGRIVTLVGDCDDRSARGRALRAGADHYLTKPLNVEQFVHVMQQAASTGWEGGNDGSNDA